MGNRPRRKERAAQYESAAFEEIQGRIAAAVKKQRKRQALSQEEAAHRCGMSTRLLQMVEAGSSNLTLTTIARLCEGLEVDVLDLVRRRKKPRPLV